KEIVLDIAQVSINMLGQTLAAQQADGAVEFVHCAQRRDACRVLCHTGAVTQASGTVVARSGDDGGKSIADDETPVEMQALQRRLSCPRHYFSARTFSSSLLATSSVCG